MLRRQTVASQLAQRNDGMRNEWPIKTIEECAAPEKYSTQIGPFGKALMADEYTDSGVPVLRGINVNQGRFHDDDFVFIDDQTADRLSKFESFPGDVLLVHKGTLGQIGLMPRERKFERYIMGNSMMRVRCDPDKLLPEYLYYWLSSSQGQHYLFSRISQVGVPQIQTPLTTLRQAALPVPPVTEQKKIAYTLSTLDEKIELNWRMNETLEAMARAIFKSWFVDFDPVRSKAEGRQPVGMPAATAALFPDSFQESPLGKIPRGWRVTSLAEEIDAIRGLSYSGKGLAETGFPLHNLNSVLEGGGYKYEGIKHYVGDYEDRHIVKPGGLIVTNTEQGFDFLLIGYPAIVPKFYGKVGLFSHHLYRVNPKRSSTVKTHFLYWLLMSSSVRPQIIGCTNGTTVNMLPPDGLERPRFALPPAELINAFERIAAPLHLRTEANYEESATLARLRDALLPKLISGDIRVPASQAKMETR